MSAPATNDLSPVPVTMTTRTCSSCLTSRIARRSSSSVRVFKALSTFGRLIVTIVVASSRSISRLSKVIRLGRDTSASRAPPPTPESRRTSTIRSEADRVDRPWRSPQRPATRRTQRSPSGEGGSALLPPEGDVVGVDHDEHVEESGDNQKRVAVLVRHRPNVASAVAKRAGNEIHRPDPEVRERREADERIAQLERKQASANRDA